MFGKTVPIVVLLLSIVSISVAESEPVEFTVMTYNVKAGFGGEEKRLQPEEGLERVARIIEEHDPDVVILQEIDLNFKRSDYIDEMDWLKNRLSWRGAAFGPAIKSGTSFYGVGILLKNAQRTTGGAKHNLFKPDYSESHPEHPGYFSEQRVLLHVSAIVKGVTVDFYSTHLGLTADQRVEQVKQISEITANRPNPVIIGGDFNATFESAEMEPLRNSLLNPFEVLKVPEEERLTFPDGVKPDRGIDGFFVSEDVRIKEVKVILDETAASDHNPVVMKVQVKNKENKERVGKKMQLKIMTHNIRAGFGGERERLPVKVGLERVAKVAEGIDPDVILLQEVEKDAPRTEEINEAEWLKDRLGFDVSTYADADYSHNRTIGNAVLIKSGNLSESETYLLFKPDYSESHPEYPDYYSEQRVLNRTTACFNGIEVNFFCTHLGLTQEQRDKQVADILEVMKDYPQNCILGGDFNATLDAPEMQPLMEQFNEAFATLNVPGEERLTFPGGAEPTKAIDLFFTTKDIEINAVRVLRDETLASDHNPVVLTVTVAEQ